MTPTRSDIDALRLDLHRLAVQVIHARECYGRGLLPEGSKAMAAATTAANDLAAVAAVWIEDIDRDDAVADLVEEVARLPAGKAPKPPVVAVDVEDGQGSTVGKYEVRKIGRNRFVRCPEVVCAKRVTLTDEETVEEIESVLRTHNLSGDCTARKATR